MIDSDVYQEELLDQARKPQNYGQIIQADIVVSEFNASCGDMVTVYIKLKEDGEQKAVAAMKWQGNGCILSQAGMSVLSQLIIGMKVRDIKVLDQQVILDELSLKKMSPLRIKCVILGLSAIKKAF